MQRCREIALLVIVMALLAGCKGSEAPPAAVTLQVWRARPDGYLWLEQVVQTELGQPSFELGWQILETVRMR